MSLGRTMKAHNRITEEELLEKLCSNDRDELSQALSALYERYHPALSAFAARRLSDPSPERISGVLADFWENIAKNGLEAAAPGAESLAGRLYFSLSLLLARENKGHRNPDKAVLTARDLEALYSGRLSESEKKLQEERRQAVGQALVLLSRINPGDARLMWMHMKGMDFPEIASAMLAGHPGSEAEAATLAEELRERFHRPRTGARARFSELLSRILGAREKKREN
ncbi:MAG: hypothetical protein AB1921_08185 [Thermodesulfobacteriota bacterium]